MSYSYTTTATRTFTSTHAAYLSSKIATDLRQCSNFYHHPPASQIDDYVTELTEYLRAGYLAEYEFGFERDGKRIICWRYTVAADGSTDDKAGRVQPGIDVSGASYYNFLTQNSEWWKLSDADRAAFKATLPIKRTSGSLPSDGNGYWENDKNYASGGVGIGRKTFRSY